MRPLKSLAVCVVCAFLFSMVVSPALAGDDDAWAKKKGKPAENPHESVEPAYYGWPILVDLHPWDEAPHRKGWSENPANPAISANAWWMQMTVDKNPWGEDPPKGDRQWTP